MEKEDLVGRYFVNEATRIQAVSDPGGDLLVVEVVEAGDGAFGPAGTQWETSYHDLMSGWNLVP